MHIAHCDLSRDKSIGTMESHVNSDGVIIRDLRRSNTFITWVIAVCNVQSGLKTLKRLYSSLLHSSIVFVGRKSGISPLDLCRTLATMFGHLWMVQLVVIWFLLYFQFSFVLPLIRPAYVRKLSPFTLFEYSAKLISVTTVDVTLLLSFAFKKFLLAVEWSRARLRLPFMWVTCSNRLACTRDIRLGYVARCSLALHDSYPITPQVQQFMVIAA